MRGLRAAVRLGCRPSSLLKRKQLRYAKKGPLLAVPPPFHRIWEPQARTSLHPGYLLALPPPVAFKVIENTGSINRNAFLSNRTETAKFAAYSPDIQAAVYTAVLDTDSAP